MKLFARIAAIVVCFILLIAGVGAYWVSRQHVTPIIMYHRVDYVTPTEPNVTSPENFRMQMEYLKRKGFEVINLGELVESIRTGVSVPRNQVVITFDDGSKDNYTHAFPILKEYGYQATIFIPYEHIDLDDFLSESQVREMMASGIDFESHSLTHAYMPPLTEEQLRREILESKQLLEQRLGKTIDFFAYPVGGFTPAIKEMVKQAGYKAACTTNRGTVRGNNDVYELKRVRFSDKDNKDHILWMKLTGYYNLFRSVKKPY